MAKFSGIQIARSTFAFCALQCSVLLCHQLHHFTITFAQPNTYAVMLQHKCAYVLLGCLGWTLAESIGLIRTATNRSASRMHTLIR